MVKKYVNPRVSGYRDDSHAIRDLGVFGVDARTIVSAMTGVTCDVLGALAPYGHLDAPLEDGSVTIARSVGYLRPRPRIQSRSSISRPATSTART